jgi:hypothetical protein
MDVLMRFFPIYCSDQISVSTVPENEPSADWEPEIMGNEAESLAINTGRVELCSQYI